MPGTSSAKTRFALLAGHDELYQLILELAPQGISYTTILSAIPRSAASFWIGLIACF